MVPLFKEQFNDIAQLFDDAHYSGEIQKLKPYDDIYAYVEELHNSKGCECYFIDDLDENVKAAQHRGWHTFHLHKQSSASQLRESLIQTGILPA
jgi:HAD superfamily hydrolase (TIGR01509 family)